MKNPSAKILGFAVLLLGIALSGSGLWLLLSPKQYQATVRIGFDSGSGDIMGSRQFYSYDPYFIQTQLEIIQSPVVLSNAIESQSLNIKWANNTAKAVKLLQRRMNLQVIPNTTLIDISISSGNPNEAATIANAIAKAYADYRMERQKQRTKAGIQVLVDKYQNDEKQIQAIHTSLELMREKYKINKDDEAGFGLVPGFSKSITPTEQERLREKFEEQRPFWDAKRNLASMIDFHKLLAAKIDFEKINLDKSKVSLVQIINIAIPPEFPVSPNRWLGATLLVIGLFPIVGGLLLLKSSRRQSL